LELTHFTWYNFLNVIHILHCIIRGAIGASVFHADVINHIRNEMSWFKGEMWIRACREIEKSYRKWGSPLDRMEAVPFPNTITKRFPVLLTIFPS